jgi:tetratricopeptide (TPR) repeat protein
MFLSAKDNVSKSLAWMYTETGRYSEAEDLYLRGMEVKRRMDAGEENRYLLERVGELGTMYRKWKKYDKAQEYLKQMLETLKRVFGDEDEQTLDSMILVAELYRDQEKFNDAEQLLLNAEETAWRVLGDDHEITNICVTNLIALYEAWDKPEKADQWRAKLPREQGTAKQQ